MATGTKNSELLNIPFDQFSRQLIVKNIIDDVLRIDKTKKRLKILDIGGYKGKTKEFLLNDDVKILDVFDVTEPDYIKGDATKMTAKDNSYDIVCSLDVLEHIPKAKREAFIEEAARVSKMGFFMAAPIDNANKLISSAEMAANEVFKIVNGEDHRWLKEHIDYGIPTAQDISKLLKKNNLYFTIAKSNEIKKWFMIQSAYFIKSILEQPDNFLASKYLPKFHELHNLIDTSYNSNYNYLEVQGNDVAYRSVYFVSERKEDVDKVNDYLARISTKYSDNEKDKAELHVYETAFKSIAEVVNIMRLEGDELKTQLLAKDKQLLKAKLLKIKLSQNERALKDIRESTSWKITKPLRSVGVFARLIKKKGQK